MQLSYVRPADVLRRWCLFGGAKPYEGQRFFATPTLVPVSGLQPQSSG